MKKMVKSLGALELGCIGQTKMKSGSEEISKVREWRSREEQRGLGDGEGACQVTRDGDRGVELRPQRPDWPRWRSEYKKMMCIKLPTY